MNAKSNILSRRKFLTLSAGFASIVGLSGLAGASPSSIALGPGFPPETWSWTPAEKQLLSQDRADFDLVIRGKEGASVLRSLTKPVPPNHNLEKVSQRMEETMMKAGGVGLAGPQVGLSLRVATLMLDYKSKTPKTIFVRNPCIIERSDEVIEGYEGCLSIPDVGGLVKRNKWIKLRYTSQEGELLTTEAEGYNAVLWQHELDHLYGILYIDKLQGELLPMEEVRRRRKEAEKQPNQE